MRTFKGIGIIQEEDNRITNFNNQKFHHWLKLYSHPLFSKDGNELKVLEETNIMDYIKKKASTNVLKYYNKYVDPAKYKSAIVEYDNPNDL